MRSGRACTRAAHPSAGSTASTRRPSARRSRRRSTTSTRPTTWMPGRPPAWTASASCRWRQGSWPWPTPGSQPGRATRLGRTALASMSGLRWAGSPMPRSSTSAISRAASAQSRRTWRWPSSAARRRPTLASRSACTAPSSRRRTRAPPARWRWARRSTPSDLAAWTRFWPVAWRRRSARSASAPSTSSAPFRRATTIDRPRHADRSMMSATGS
jgi:hypothetical protein